MSALKPCPFCGATPLLYDLLETHGVFSVECPTFGCDADSTKHTKDEAIEAWNRRAQGSTPNPVEVGTTVQAGQGTKVKEPHFAPQEAITKDGWTEWVCPKPKGYLAQCCDCGLVHEIDTRVAKYEPRPSENFEVVTDPDLQVQWRVRRRDDLRQEIWDFPAFEPDQTPDLEAGKSRFYSVQAGQVLSDERLNQIFRESFKLIDSRMTPQQLQFARAIEQAVMAKRVPMTDAQIEHALRSEPMADNEESFALGIRHAERHHGIVGEKGGA